MVITSTRIVLTRLVSIQVEAWVAATVRNPATLEAFLRAVEAEGLQVSEISQHVQVHAH